MTFGKHKVNEIRSELERLGGAALITPEAVVDAARDQTSPLHDQFEWDDSVAGEAYRLQQARALIKRVTVSVTRADQTVVRAPVFVRNPSGEAGYRLTQSVAVSAPDRRQVMIIALTQCQTILRNLAAPELDDLISQMTDLIASLRDQQAA